MRLAIVGCGQLAQMLAIKAKAMAIDVSFLAAPGEDAQPVAGLGEVIRVADDWRHITSEQLYGQLGKPDVITVEKEQVDIDLLRALAEHSEVYPPIEAIADAGHRGREKALLTRMRIPTAPYHYAETFTQIQDAAKALGYPLVIKGATTGYDGKSQWRVSEAAELDALASVLDNIHCVVEQKIPFEREISFLAARGRDGAIAFYAPVHNEHRKGILRRSVAPAEVPETIANAGREYLRQLLEHWQYVGVLAMECFYLDGQPPSLMVNELAPRVHNSGHWTQQANVCCQFENHLRAIVGDPLGQTELSGFAGMVNILGEMPAPDAIQSDHAVVHDYKKSPRPGRKLGHVNVTHNDKQALLVELESIERQLGYR